jgi:hypothetical protein
MTWFLILITSPFWYPFAVAIIFLFKGFVLDEIGNALHAKRAARKARDQKNESRWLRILRWATNQYVHANYPQAIGWEFPMDHVGDKWYLTGFENLTGFNFADDFAMSNRAYHINVFYQNGMKEDVRLIANADREKGVYTISERKNG